MYNRIGKGALALGVITATVFATASPALADESEADALASTCIKSLKVIATEDDWDGDEPYMTNNKKLFWNGPNGMGVGDKATINKSITVGNTLAVYEEDSPDADDFIESVTVVNGSGVWEVNGDGAVYDVQYSRGAC